jgi:hypothetical protein
MMNEAERDRQLLENLDRILTGRGSEIREARDDDSRTALNFARKMASLREKPSKEFRDSLKAQLIHQLAEQERKERSRGESFLLLEIRDRTMWRWTVAAAITVVIAAAALLASILLNRSG